MNPSARGTRVTAKQRRLSADPWCMHPFSKVPQMGHLSRYPIRRVDTSAEVPHLGDLPVNPPTTIAKVRHLGEYPFAFVHQVGAFPFHACCDGVFTFDQFTVHCNPRAFPTAPTRSDPAAGAVYPFPSEFGIKIFWLSTEFGSQPIPRRHQLQMPRMKIRFHDRPIGPVRHVLRVKSDRAVGIAQEPIRVVDRFNTWGMGTREKYRT